MKKEELKKPAPAIQHVYMPKGISHCYQFDQFISVLRVVGWYFTFFIQISIEQTVCKHV